VGAIPVSNLELSPRRILKLGANLQQDGHDIIAPTITTNANLFVWSAADFPIVDP